MERRALSLVETTGVIAVGVAIVAVAMPLLAAGSRLAGDQRSLGNLAIIGAGHALYALDHGGRQLTVIVDDISTYGTNQGQAFFSYEAVNGAPHPPLPVGWGPTTSGGFADYHYFMTQSANHGVVQPIGFFSGGGQLQYFGSFRLMNMRPFHAYVGGRVYDEIYFPPNDVAPREVAEHAFESPWELELDVPTATPNNPAWTSYCMSPAAMFDPAVMAHPDDGGWENPWLIDDAFRSPSLFAAAYPNLKTFVLEHHWTTSDPASTCNPSFLPGTYAGCEPYYFNHTLAAAPATLFYDLSTRQLPNTEVNAADMAVLGQTGSGLWSRDTAFGPDGYLGEYGYDDIRLSHHVLTTEGILGRDTTEGAAVAAPTPRRRGGVTHDRAPRSPAGRRAGFGAEP